MIYFIHIRKTGGTSIKFSFLSQFTDKPGKAYLNICNNRVAFVGNKCFVGDYRIPHDFYFAYSHEPFYKVLSKLPDETFIFTCFRDPVARIISHYKMLKEYEINGIDHPCMKTEGKWLGNNFNDFINRIPKECLQNQLYMFSRNYNIEDALILVSTLDHIMFLENLSTDIKALERKLTKGKPNIKLKYIHTRKTNLRTGISKQTENKLREALNDEYKFLERVKNEIYKTNP